MGTIPVGGKLEFAAADGAGHLFVNVEQKARKYRSIRRTWSSLRIGRSPHAQEPTGLAIDAKNHRLFSGCANKMMAVIDTDSGKVIATPPIGVGVDADRV